MDFRRVLLRKPVLEIVASGESSQQRLAKVLGPFSIAAMGIGAIIGAGIFVLTGTAAALYAGPAIVLSFVLGLPLEAVPVLKLESGRARPAHRLSGAQRRAGHGLAARSLRARAVGNRAMSAA